MVIHSKMKEMGQGLVEYALILVLVAVVSIIILALMGTTISDVFSCMLHEMNAETKVVNGVYKYMLVDATTDEDISRAQCGQTLVLSENINFRGYTAGDVGRVTYQVILPDGSIVDRTENVPPWAVFGDSSGDYGVALGGSPDPGRYVINAKTDTGESSTFIFFVE